MPSSPVSSTFTVRSKALASPLETRITYPLLDSQAANLTGTMWSSTFSSDFCRGEDFRPFPRTALPTVGDLTFRPDCRCVQFCAPSASALATGDGGFTLGRRRVLVVDDSPAIRETMAIVLGTEYEVEAITPAEYLSAGIRSDALPDVLVIGAARRPGLQPWPCQTVWPSCGSSTNRHHSPTPPWAVTQWRVAFCQRNCAVVSPRSPPRLTTATRRADSPNDYTRPTSPLKRSMSSIRRLHTSCRCSCAGSQGLVSERSHWPFMRHEETVRSLLRQPIPFELIH